MKVSLVVLKDQVRIHVVIVRMVIGQLLAQVHVLIVVVVIIAVEVLGLVVQQASGQVILTCLLIHNAHYVLMVNIVQLQLNQVIHVLVVLMVTGPQLVDQLRVLIHVVVDTSVEMELKQHAQLVNGPVQQQHLIILLA